MTTIIAATRNEGKIREMNAITQALGMTIVSRDQAGVPPVEIEETGTTFEENSEMKARAIAEMMNQPAIADDSGLCCDYLDGAPGVLSARFSGGDDSDNNRKLVALTEPVPEEDRTARYVCVMTLVYPDGRMIQARGEIEGHIITQGRGQGGFGYDPYFVPQGYDKTFAEFDAADKNAISHRGQALSALMNLLEKESLQK